MYYGATLNNIKLVHWPLMDGLLHLVQQVGDRVAPPPAQAHLRCTKCNSGINSQCTALNLITVLLCGFNVPIKGLTDLTPPNM